MFTIRLSFFYFYLLKIVFVSGWKNAQVNERKYGLFTKLISKLSLSVLAHSLITSPAHHDNNVNGKNEISNYEANVGRER